MKKTPFFSARRPALLLLLLLLCLCIIGSSYAAWARQLRINTALSSGDFKVLFGESRLYSVEIVDINGQRVGDWADSGEIDCVLDSEQKQARLSLERALLLEELMYSNRFLALRFPMVISEESTVRAILPYRADLTQPAEEQLEFTPIGYGLIVAEEEYELPPGLQNMAVPLQWDVYRQVDWEGDQLICSIFLKPGAESLQALSNPGQLSLDVAELPLGLDAYVMPLDDWSSGMLQAQINVHYEFSVPLFIEQAHP